MKRMSKVFVILLVMLMVYSLPINAFAASIGESIPSAESGWTRYQYDCGKITYYGGTWSMDNTHSKSYLSPYGVNGTGFKFKFAGTKFRIIAAKWNTFSNDITVKIDGENVDTVSFYSGGTTASPLLMYEKTELDNKVHEVEFINNTPNYLSISAIDINENGSLIRYDAVENLIATAGKSEILLNWDEVDNATSYNIKRSTTKGGPYEEVYSTSDTNSFKDIKVNPDTTYFYVVSAVVSGTEGENSKESSAKIEESSSSNNLKVVVEVNEKIQLSVNDNLASNTNMKWTTSDSSMANVDSSGVVTGVKAGNAVITVTNQNGTYTDTINILVIEGEEEVAIDLKVGETRRLTIDDLAGTTSATWTSDDQVVATVSSTGKVTAVAQGTTYVIVKDDQGKEIGKICIRVRN